MKINIYFLLFRKLLFTTWKSISSEMEAQGVKLFVE